MLSRIANSLFWMGRYLERADQSARYIKVHYYSALDAPLASKHDFIFESILTMLGLDEEYKKNSKNYQEEKINNLIALQGKMPGEPGILFPPNYGERSINFITL
jgi:uncharacterized alpha-E superfamily protein